MRRLRILVVGASGFIGSAVVRSLVASEFDVFAGLRDSGASSQRFGDKATPVHFDLENPLSISTAVRGMDVIIHCARDTNNDPGSHPLGLAEIIAGAQQGGITRIVYFSSVAVYGNTAGEVTEATVPSPVSPYGKAKYQAEKMLAHSSGPSLQIVVLRPTLVYGPDGQEWTVGYIEDLVAGRLTRLGSAGERRANLVHVGDIAQFCATLATAPLVEFQTIIVNGEDLPSFNAFWEQISVQLGFGTLPPPKARVVHEARRISRKLMRGAFKIKRKLIPQLSPNMLSRATAYLEKQYMHSHSDLSLTPVGADTRFANDAAKKLGFRPVTSIAAGVEGIAVWWKTCEPMLSNARSTKRPAPLDLEHGPVALRTAYDICIIGAGPAGISLARELSSAGLSVLLAETGGLKEVAATDDLNRGLSVGHPARAEYGRHRVFGGSGSKWGGRCATLDPLDFERRDWIENAGWPIDYGELLPYYERAKAAANFDRPWILDTDVLAQHGLDVSSLAGSGLTPFVWRVASTYAGRRKLRVPHRLRAFDWADAYGAELRARDNVDILLHATLVEMHSNDDGSTVEAVTVAALNGHRVHVRATQFVLCCSGIENPRALLNAPPAMLARMNRYDTIGRFLTQHPRGSIGTVSTSTAGAWHLQRMFNMFQRPPWTPVEYEIGFALNPTFQRQNQLVNASAVLVYTPGESSAWGAIKRLKTLASSRRFHSSVFADATRAIGRFPVGNLARRFLAGREIVHRDPVINVVIDLEQAPIRDSRIYLSSQRDVLGIPRVVVDWRISDIERRTAALFATTLRQEFERMKLGTIHLADWLTSGKLLSDSDLAGNYHYIGTTRMSTQPEQGVVDINAKVHGIDNLYVAGASVFPTGGHANPTLTIVALTLRLADYLRALSDASNRLEGPSGKKLSRVNR